LSFAVSVDVNAFLSSPPPFHAGSASASFLDDYVFTVFDGTGNGFFCAAIINGHSTGASAGISFGGALCPVSPPVASKPFTFGVPQIISIGMGGQASAIFDGQADAVHP